MIPVKSNINKKSCNPISSNCVDWEGGDIIGLELCNTDSISDVFQKTNIIIQSIKKELDLSDLDLKCLWEQCVICPDPTKTLKSVLSLIISHQCTLEEAINNLNPNSNSTEITLDVPSCLQPVNAITLEKSTQLPVSQFVTQIGLYICNIINSQLNNIGIDITNLENEVAANTSAINAIPNINSLLAITPTCFTTPNGTSNFLDVLNGLSSDYCTLKGQITGTSNTNSIPIGLSNDIKPINNKVGVPYKSVTSLNDSTHILFTNPATDIGTLLAHFGSAINDLRTAVSLIQYNCCQITCTDIIVDFDIQLSDDRTQLFLYFAQKTNIPVGFGDYNDGTVITITDSNGTIYTSGKINIVNHLKNDINSNGNEKPITITEVGLNTSLPYVVTMSPSMTDGSLTCSKCITKNIAYNDTCAFCTISVSSNE